MFLRGRPVLQAGTLADIVFAAQRAEGRSAERTNAADDVRRSR
jgi:hypothetical protein